MSASRRTNTAGRVCIGILVTTLLAGVYLRPTPKALSAPAKSPEVAQPEVAAVTGPASVSGVSIQSVEDGKTVVDVATSSPTPYRVLRLSNPQRLVVDLQDAHKATPHESYETSSPLVKRVRVGQFQEYSPAIVRVVADLTGNPAFDIHATSKGVRIELKPRETMQPLAPSVMDRAVETPLQTETVPPQQPIPPPSAAGSPANVTPIAPPVQSQPPAPVPPQPPAPSQAVSVPSPSAPVLYRASPFKSLAQNQKMLDSLGLRIVLNYSYRKGSANEAAWKTKGVSGVEGSRLLIRPTASGSFRTIELALTTPPQGGYEVVVYGAQVEQNTESANPDLGSIQQMVNDEITRMQQSPPAVVDERQLSYETYYLSYVAADRAIALLKAMGYTTVEYNEQAGDSIYDKIYNPIKLGTGRPPIVVKLIDSTKTSLMDPAPSQPGVAGVMQNPQMAQQGGIYGSAISSVPQIGGTFLHEMTSGEPQQRFLILYDKDDTQELQSLLNLLQTTVDVPAREIMIEALVIELNTNRSRDLGITFEAEQNKAGIFSTDIDATTGAALPFVFNFDKSGPKIATFKATLSALLETGEAQVLSNPSVLVLDDRQARIQIGQQVPVTKSLSTQAGIISSVDYFPVGIVLNLRPRVSDDGGEITMQTETIVSSINRFETQTVSGTQTLVAPVVDNRQVQSIVRVSNNTPFIIGGLISNNDNTQMSGIPLLSQIPGLGALFRRTTTTKLRQEVIIVVTPHVVPLEDKYFSYLIPKDTDQFDRFNYKLFRNAYRIRGNDLFDLEFVYDSNVYKQLVSRVTAATTKEPQLKAAEPYASVLKGGAPGEEILVRRMLWEIIDKTHFTRYISPDKIIFFESNPTAVGGAGFQLAFLNQKLKGLDGQNALALTFEAHPKGTEERPFVPPKAVLSYPTVTVQNYPEVLINGNDRNPDGTPHDWQVLVSKNYSGIRVSPLELLQGVIVLKKLLELNRSMPLTLKEFHIGRQIVFPSQEELQQGYHLVDREVAQLFYEVYNYYPSFEQEFNRETRQMNAMLDKVNDQQ